MQKTFFFLACFIIYALCCSAQQYPFVHYTPRDGLVNSRVRKAYQDSRGRMYFMTYGGLSIYDGTHFANYTAQNGLAADMVNDVLEMGDDSLWIACNINQLNYVSRGKIGTFRTADGFYPTINKFIKTKDGSIYAVADEGLFLFGQNRFTRLPFTDRRGRDAGRFLIDVMEWNDWLLIISDSRLSGIGPANFFAFNKGTRKSDTDNGDKFIFTACIGSDKRIFIADSRGLLQLLDTTALIQGTIRFLPPPNEYRKVGPGIIYMLFDQRNNLWLYSANQKISRIDATGSIKDFSLENGMSSNSFSSIFHDREGSAWITMSGSGIDKLVNDNIEKYDRLAGFPVSNFYTNEFTDSVYFYSWTAHKMLIMDGQKISVYGLAGNPIFPNGFYASAEKIYISNGKDLSMLSLNKQGKFEAALVFKDTAELSNGNIFVDHYGHVVLSGTSYLTLLDGKRVVGRYPLKDYIDQVGFDKRNRMWAASRANELFVFEISPGNPEGYFRLLKSYEKKFPALSARSMSVDGRDNVWVGTRNGGLYCFQFDSNLDIRSIQHYTTREGLSDNFIVHLTCDNENNIWVSTSSGLDKISLSGNGWRIENITRSNSIYEQVLKTFVNKNGIAWSYTADGNLIRTGKTSEWPAFLPSLFITGIKVGNTAIDSLSRSGSFSHKQNSFSISVAAPSFYDEHQIKFSYLMQGSGNDQWSDPSNNSTFNFINLNPGSFTLKIKAMFPGGRYPDQTTEYHFVIHPPWWQTWWFRVLSGIVVIGLFIFAFTYYYRRKLENQRISLEKQKAIEKERTRIATDIHDDLGSGLSRIRYLGEMVKLKTLQQQDILPDIEKIAVFSDEMVDKMNEIVWALNEKNDSLEAIISYVRSFAAEYLSNNNLFCIINLPDEIPYCIIKGETRRNIFLSVKECLHNIVKHAGATETIMTMNIRDQLVIQIHDNGRGINWEEIRPFSNGVTNIKKRMKDAGGTVEFRNEKGTTVVLKIPLL